ncbi:type I-E CRISPR-associated protein Cse2/CasB [Flaviflexus equikiangi]|uniref:type I-E CRISPR-associated protein Cse2/CasB n=1 Tax=Flaviflexus equikiangi TaxID=2758573 RepID=UPI0015F3C143|nr:type I-E CRISPR-associated protein Cse2/CasB [Flaviflexus equikiangi]
MNEETKAESLQEGIGRTVSILQRQFLEAENPSARRTLAVLRRAVDEEPGENPEVWQLVLEALPERFIGQRDEPTAGEWAGHLALTLYAIHQRGNTRPVHIPGISFGSAAGTLMRGRTASTKRSYDALLSATNFPTRRHYLRALVGLMATDSTSTNAIGLDYGRLASDIYRLQFAQYRPSLLRAWGRDFYRAFSWAPAEPSAPTTN